MENETNNKNKLKKFWQCKTCKIGIIVIAVILFLALLIDPILNWTAKGKIEEAIKNSENGRQAKIGHLSYSFLGNNLTCSNIYLLLSNNSKFSKKNIGLRAEKIEFGGVGWLSLVFGSGLSMDEVRIVQPYISIHDSSSVNTGQDSTEADSSNSLITEKELYNMLPGKLRPLEIDDIQIDNAELIRTTIRDSSTVNDTLKNINLSVNDILIDNEPDTKNLVFADGFDLHIDSLSRRSITLGYQYTANDIHISSDSGKSISVNEFSIKPYISDKEFFSRHIYRTQRFVINLHNITVNNFDIASLIKKKSIQINEINIPEFYFEVLTDKRLPQNPNQTMAAMPPESMQELGYNVDIKKIALKGKVRKLASHPYFEEKAEIFFTDVDFQIANLANYGDKECTLLAKANMMGSGPLEVHLAIDLTNRLLNLNYYGSLGAMEASEFNKHLIVENKIRIDSGKIEKVDFNVKINNGVSDIIVTPIYSNLKIKLIDEKDKTDKSFKSFIMDFLKLRNNNPEGNDEPKVGRAVLQPGVGDTFLDFVWQSLLKGLGDVVGF